MEPFLVLLALSVLLALLVLPLGSHAVGSVVVVGYSLKNPFPLSIVAQVEKERIAKIKKIRFIIFPTKACGVLRASTSAGLFTLNHEIRMCRDLSHFCQVISFN